MTIFGYSTSLIIVFICYIIGNLIKKSSVPDKYIPTIMGFLGMLISLLFSRYLDGFPCTSLADTLTYGLASGLASTGFHQAIKQFIDNPTTNYSVTYTTDTETIVDEEDSEILGEAKEN